MRNIRFVRSFVGLFSCTSLTPALDNISRSNHAAGTYSYRSSRCSKTILSCSPIDIDHDGMRFIDGSTLISVDFFDAEDTAIARDRAAVGARVGGAGGLLC